MPRLIKVYGERNTGTNVTCQVLIDHFHCSFLPEAGRLSAQAVDTLMDAQGLTGTDRLLFAEALLDDSMAQHLHEDLGWKHGCPPLQAILQHPQRSEILFVLITKSPYSWLLSFYQRPYHQLYSQRLNFSQFIRHYWLTSRREGLPALMENPIALYNAKLTAYHKLQKVGQEQGLNVIHLCYEDLLFHFESSLEQFCDFLERKTQHWQKPEKSSKPDDMCFSDYQHKYHLENILAQITHDDLAFINRYLSPQLLHHFAYSLESA